MMAHTIHATGRVCFICSLVETFAYPTPQAIQLWVIQMETFIVMDGTTSSPYR